MSPWAEIPVGLSSSAGEGPEGAEVMLEMQKNPGKLSKENPSPLVATPGYAQLGCQSLTPWKRPFLVNTTGSPPARWSRERGTCLEELHSCKEHTHIHTHSHTLPSTQPPRPERLVLLPNMPSFAHVCL